MLLVELHTGLAFLEHDSYPMAWVQRLGSLQGLGLISSEDRCHRDSHGQVSDHVKQQAHSISRQVVYVHYNKFNSQYRNLPSYI